MATKDQTNAAEETLNPLRGVLLYEDREAHARTLNLYAYLAIAVAREIPLQFSWWAFPTLDDKSHAQAARNAVAAADLVIIAGHAAPDWPAEFKTWVESWGLPKERRLSALGALLSNPDPAGPGMICGRQAYLQYVAARQELDFLAATPSSVAPLLKAKLGLSPAPGLDDPANRPDYSPYCGING